MQQLLQEVGACWFCEMHLPFGPKPIVEAAKNSKIVLISQTPGRIVH